VAASIEELEELGRKVMECSVTAEYLDLPGMVAYLDQVFALIVRDVVDARRRLAVAATYEVEESVEGL